MVCDAAAQTLEETRNRLKGFQDASLKPLVEYILPIIRKAGLARNKRHEAHALATQIDSRFKRDLHAVVVHSLPVNRVFSTLSYVLFDGACKVFKSFIEEGSAPDAENAESSYDVGGKILQLCSGLQEVGLGQERAQRAFAQAMDKLVTRLIASRYMQVEWERRTSVTYRLRGWIQLAFAPFVDSVTACFTERPDCVRDDEAVGGNAAEIKAWQEMAIWRLGKARVAHHYDYVLQWDRSLGAILDLKVTNYYITSYMSIVS